MLQPAAVAASIPILYSSMSINEYITHRWYQHAEFNKTPWMQKTWKFLTRAKDMPRIRGGGHVEHHAETYDDMTLKTDAVWKKTPASKLLDTDIYRGTAFTWPIMFLMCVQMMPITLPALAFIGFSLNQSLLCIFLSVLVHTTIWNTLHPDMHGLPIVPLNVGPPSEWFAFLRNTSYFKWIYANHEGHHVAGGQANYNVCCPGTDHLLGTYMPPVKWKPMVRPKPSREELVTI